MKVCPTCQETYSENSERCTSDGAWLIDPDSSRDPADAFLGRILAGRYDIRSKLGAGAVGAVFRAIDQQTGGPVALKVLMPSAGYAEERAGRRLRREAHAVSQLSSPNTVRITDFGETRDGVPYLAMELIEGEELADYLNREGRIPFGEAVDIADQVCISLEEAHSRGIIHRDLKPENIFLTTRDGRPGFVKVLDFGLVKLVQTDDEMEPTRITSANLVVGTPHYMAPEQISGGSVGPTTDIYALGVLLYRMTTGSTPFYGDNPIVVMQAQLRQIPSPPSVLVTHYPKALDSLVVACLEKDPANRPQTIEELRGLLDALNLKSPRAETDGAQPAAQRGMEPREQADLQARPMGALDLSRAAFMKPAYGADAPGYPRKLQRALIASAWLLAAVTWTSTYLWLKG